MKFSPTKEQLLRNAFSHVFNLGEKHWMYSDSENPNHWKNCDKVLDKYNEAVDNVLKEVFEDVN